MTRNNFVIYSGKAAYVLKKERSDLKNIKLKSDPFEDSCVHKNDLTEFNGTLVAMDISLDTTTEFKQILNEIGEIYDVAIRERRKNRYRKPNFI